MSAAIAQTLAEAVCAYDLRGAIVFADDSVTRALALGVGMPALLGLGVRNVLRLGVAPRPEGRVCLPGTGDATPDYAVIMCAGSARAALDAIRATPMTSPRDNRTSG